MSKKKLVPLVLLSLILAPSFWARANGATFSTEEEEYSAGEKVVFLGEGYVVGNSYKINVSLVVTEDGVESLVPVGSDVSFDAEAEGIRVEWAVPFDAENGTYRATILDVTDEESISLVAQCEFEIASGLGDRLGAVVGDLEALGEMIETEVEEEARQRLLASLDNCMRKVEAAVALLEQGKNNTARNQLRAARNMLTAFVHKVWAAAGKSIDLDTALSLNETAFTYISYIDSLIPTLIPIGKQLALNIRETLSRQEIQLAKFSLRKSIRDSENEEDASDDVDDAENNIQLMLEGAEARRGELLGLFEEGEINDLELLMEQRGVDLETVKAKELAEDLMVVLQEEFPGVYEVKGKGLGQYVKLAKELLGGSEVQGPDQDRGRGSQQGDEVHGNGNGNGNGKGKGNQNDNPGRGQGTGQGKGKGNSR